MIQTFGKLMGLGALVLLCGVVLTGMFGTSARCAEEGGSSVRMAVDPTVLPPVLPPGETDQSDTTVTPDAEPEKDADSSDGASMEADLAPEKPAGTAQTPTAASQKTELPEKPAAEPTANPTANPAANPTANPAAKPESVVKPEPPIIVVDPPVQKPVEKVAQQPEKSSTPGTIRRIGLQSTPHGFVLTLTGDRPVGDTSYLKLANPTRLVIDLRQAWKLGTRNVIRSASGLVRHVVVGEHPDRLRFVVHFRNPPSVIPAPEFRRDGNILTVSVQTD